MPSDLIIGVDGSSSPTCERVCAWCKKSMGALVCLPEQAGGVSHGICDACLSIELQPVSGERPESGGLK